MQIWLWIGFIVFVLLMLWIDLSLLHRDPKAIHTKEALAWTGVCAVLALLFNVAIYFIYDGHLLGIGEQFGTTLSGWDAAVLFFTGWLVEQSLSLDNVFVIALIFAYFKVPLAYQHRVLFWGIMGALVMRGAMIGVGTALIQRFAWITYVFGAILIVTAIKMLLTKDEGVEPDRNPFVRLARRWYPVTGEFEGQRFFTRLNGKRAITPLFLVLLVVESTDVVFAIDSIPAIFGIFPKGMPPDAFIVFTSNVFAILCLRSMYFALASVISRFHYLKYSLMIVLAYVGAKMLLAWKFHISPELSLAVIVALLAAGVIASVLSSRKSAQGDGEGRSQ